VAFLTLTGPRGIAAIREKTRTVQRLEEENATLRREVEQQREKIQKLKESRSEQELEIRRRLKYLKKGESYLVLPPEKPANPQKPAQ
jgi:cell division protein FtsB